MQLHKGAETVLVIPDLQAPFEHKDAFQFLLALKILYKPTKVVSIGDSVDQHALGDYPHDPDGWSAGHEYKEAMKRMAVLYSIFPEAQEVESNHNDRIYRKAFKMGIPKAYLRSYKEFMQAPEGWDFVDTVEIDGIKYEHGHAFGGIYAARHAAVANMKSTVIGHHHSTAGVHYIANSERMIFGMNTGCLIDVDAYAFAYGKRNKLKPTLGAGVVKQGVPYFIPMMLNSKGRWTQEIIV